MKHRSAHRIAPHRCFFPAATLYAAIAIPLWLLIRAGHIAPPALLPAGLWHVQEMLFGYVFAVIAGYLLTPVTVPRMAALAALWLAGRLIWLTDNLLPDAATFVIACAFPLALSWMGAARFKAAKRARNRVFAVILLCLGAVAVIFYGLIVAGQAALAYRVIYIPLFLILLFILTMGGRLIPPATIGALRDTGREVRIPFQPHHESAIIGCAAALIGFELLPQAALWSGAAALALAITVLARMRTWHSVATLNRPDLWPLHLGYAWVAVGFGVLGLARLGIGGTQLGAVHLLTLGGIGTVSLTMLYRVTQQRQRRWQLKPYRLILIQVLLAAAVVTRFISTWPAAPDALLTLSAGAWSLAFLLFTLYALPAYLPANRRSPQAPE